MPTLTRRQLSLKKLSRKWPIIPTIPWRDFHEKWPTPTIPQRTSKKNDQHRLFHEKPPRRPPRRSEYYIAHGASHGLCDIHLWATNPIIGTFSLLFNLKGIFFPLKLDKNKESVNCPYNGLINFSYIQLFVKFSQALICWVPKALLIS